MTAVMPTERPPTPAVPASLPTPALRWEIQRGLTALDELAPAWDALARRNALSPTADALWMRCFWRAFSGDDDQLHIHTLWRGDELMGVLPLRQTGRWLRAWSTVANGHTPFVLYATDTDFGVVAREILAHLLESADTIDLERFLAQGPLCHALITEATERGLPVAQEARPGDAVLPLFGPWDEFHRSLPENIERDTPRKRRKLERLGKLDFEVVRGGERLDERLQACFELETRGWKGRHGSPIIARPQTHRFYTGLAHAAAAAGRFALYLLRCDDKLIAFEFCLRGDRQLDMLKLSFDPACSAYSPGNVLRYFVFQTEIEQGQVDTYRFGEVSEWKQRWTRHVEPLVRLRIYRRDAKGRLACLAGPRLRNGLKEWRGLRQAVLWARKLRAQRRGP